MANKSVLELAVGTGQWDAGLKKAKQALDNFTQAQGGIQKALAEDNEKMAKFVEMMGDMSSTATSTKGQLREMSQVLTDLTSTYRNLSDEEKSSPFGKSLAKSIESLTARAGDVQDAMSDVQASIKNAASDTRLLDQMTQGAQLLTAGFQGLTGAGKLLGVNMGDNVEVIAKLQAAMGVMNSLTTIQNALQKQSALMMGLSAIKAKLLAGNLTAAAVATKALSVAMKGLGIGLAIAAITTIIDKLGIFSSSSDKATDSTDRFNDALERMDNKVKELQTGFQSLISYMQQIGSGTDALDNLRKQAADEEVSLAVAEYNRLFNGGQGGVAGRFMTAFNQVAIPQSVQQQALDKITAARERQAKVYAEIGNRQKAGDFFNSNWNTLNTEKEINAAIGYFRNLRSEMEKGSAEYAEMTRRIDALQAKITTGGRGGGGGGKGGAASLAPQYSVAGLTEDLKYLQQEQQKATSPEEWRTYADSIRGVEDEIMKLKGELSSLGTSTDGGISISGILSEKLRKDQVAFRNQKLNVSPVERQGQVVSVGQTLGSLAGGMNQIAGGIEQLGIDIPEGFNKAIGVMQAVAAILTGISTVVTIIAAIQGTKAIPIIGWALARGGLVKAAGGYQVPGNNYSNDMVPALLNSGELVLNKAQQGNLAAQLSGGQGGYAAQPYVNGEMILLGTNNYLGRSGQGEVVTTKMLKSMGLMK